MLGPRESFLLALARQCQGDKPLVTVALPRTLELETVLLN